MSRLIKLYICALLMSTVGLIAVERGSPEAFTKQIGDSLRFSIELPREWQTEDMGSQILAWPKSKDVKQDQNLAVEQIPIKVLITAVDLTGSPLATMDLKQLFDASIEQVKVTVDDLQLIQTNNETINNYMAQWGLMTYQLPGAKSSIEQLSYMFKEKNKAYVVECLVNKDQWQQYADSCKTIIASFKILEPEVKIIPPIEPPKEMKPIPIENRQN